jgi:hypothetical protein
MDNTLQLRIGKRHEIRTGGSAQKDADQQPVGRRAPRELLAAKARGQNGAVLHLRYNETKA